MFYQAITAQQRYMNLKKAKIHITVLTDKEKEMIFELTRKGWQVGAMAEKLNLGYSTVYNYRRQEQRRNK